MEKALIFSALTCCSHPSNNDTVLKKTANREASKRNKHEAYARAEGYDFFSLGRRPLRRHDLYGP